VHSNILFSLWFTVLVYWLHAGAEA